MCHPEGSNPAGSAGKMVAVPFKEVLDGTDA